MSTEASGADEKTRLRRRLQARRESLPPSLRRRHGRRIKRRLLELPELQAARSVFVYVSRGSEADTQGLIRLWLKQGRIVCVPRLRGKTRMEAVRLHRWEQLAPGAHGILTVAEPAACAEVIEAAIVPGLGFTEQGYRIGLGAGYYDRWIAAHPRALLFSPVYECQLIEQLPVMSWDLPVHWIATERRLIRVA